MDNIHDTIIIGGGPAGLAASIYSARNKLDMVLFEKGRLGGQISITDELANYPGFYSQNSHDLIPANLIDKMRDQALSFGAKIESKTVADVDFSKEIKEVKTSDGIVHKSRTVIIATGAEPRKLGAKGEREFTGKGVSYCATCDADFFTDLEVFCVGGGDTSVEEAMYLTKFARKVTLVVRKDFVRCAKSIAEKANKNEKLEIKFRTELLEVSGDGMVQKASFKNNETGETWEHIANEDDGLFGVFIFIGYNPMTSLFNDKVDMKDGYIITNEEMATNVDGVFAAGDLRPKMLRQVVTAVSDGAIAAMSVDKYISHHFSK